MNSSTQKEQIRDLQDLVERVSGELPLPGKCTENAKTQYKRLRGVSFSICPSDWNINANG